MSKTIAAGFLFAVVFTALAHGAVEAWSVMIFELLVLALILVWAIKVVVDKRLNLVIPNITFPIAALAGVGLVQSVAFADSSGARWSLSFDVEATRATVVVLIFLLIMFVIGANFFSSRERLSALAGFLVIYGLAMAVFALIQHFTWNGKFYWLRPNTTSASPFGPFVNHNHFAGYMELLIPLPVGLIITRAVRAETRLLYGFAAIVMGMAAIISLSRGGMISLAAGIIFLLALSAWMPKSRRGSHSQKAKGLPGIFSTFRRLPSFVSQSLAVVAIVAGIVWGILWIGGSDRVLSRIANEGAVAGNQPKETFFQSRGWVWRDTLTMISANPFLGVGLGAYGTAFSIYSLSDGTIRVPQAHNDYLQMVADCGIVGGGIALWFIILMFRNIRRGIKSPDPMLSGIALGGGSAIFAMFAHSLFDFNLQLPSNALLFLLLTAVVANIGAIVGQAKEEAGPDVRRDMDSLPATVSADIIKYT